MAQAITIDFVAKTSRAIGDIGRLNKAVGNQATTAQKVGAGIRKAALPATIALGAMAAGAKVAVDAAADMNESLSKTEVLFGSAADDIKEWSKTTATAFGVSRKSALDAAGTFATFGKSAGLTGKDLGAFSKDFTGLAADLASFNNTSPEEAIEAIGSALRGEAEPMRKYGVLLDDASMRQEALKLGLIKTTKEALTPQQKVLAAQALIYAQTADAQGDFSRTSDSLSNKQKTLTAQVENLKASLGQALVPVVTVAVGVLQGMATWVSENETAAKVLIGTVAGLAAAIVAANAAMKVYAISTKAAEFATKLFNGTLKVNPIGIVVTALAALAAAVVVAWNTSETFRNIVKSVWEWIKNLASALKGPAVAALKVLETAFEVATAPIRVMIAAIEKAIELWKKLKGAIQGTGKVPPVLQPGFTPPGRSSTLFQTSGLAAPRARDGSIRLVLEDSQRVDVDEEIVARAIQRLVLRSDARNGRALYI
jgi:hypothetical protein